jgi:hypothetical protein
MKTRTRSLNFSRLLMATLAIATISLLSVQPARAGYIVTLQQVGSNVVATGSGAIDLTGLSFGGGGTDESGMGPSQGFIFTGPFSATPTDVYTGFSGPTNFGSGDVTLGSSGSGRLVGIDATRGFLAVPFLYRAGALSDSTTYNNATFASLGVTPGTYLWTWGTGGADQNFTLVIPAAAVPDSGSSFGLLIIALGGLFGVNRFRARQLA